ncbi:MAG TPA: N-acyl-D-amino acid deacylase [Bacteroidetes bacterium]|nr:N-acyl-D-amino acid deacylase [Bacteroidota bacterium]
MFKKLSCVFLVLSVWISCSRVDLPPNDIVYDILIQNAQIVDGSGAKPYHGSLLIKDGVISYVGSDDLDDFEAMQIIDADGKVVSPGFIDAHAHGNAEKNPEFRNFWSMGVTSILLGMDGSSAGIEDLIEWMNVVDKARPGLNIVPMTGHGTARNVAKISLETGPDESQLAEMARILEDQFKQGSFGVSTGIEYIPGRFADQSELAIVSEVVARYNGVIMSHVRNEDESVVRESVRELVRMGSDGGARVHVSHIKVVYGKDVSSAEGVLSVMDSARVAGQDVTADVYPYTASYTGIGILFPDWALPPHDFDEVARTRRAELAEYLRNRVNLRNGPEATLLGTSPWAGRTLAEIADSLDKPFEEVLIDHIPPGSASAAYFVMDINVMRRFLEDPHVVVSTDGSPTMLHPRGYGSFAKIIRQFAVEESLIPIETIVHKMSGRTAEIVGLHKDRIPTSQMNYEDLHYLRRGFLKSGFAADVLVFDPEQVMDHATFENPHQYSTGFDHVIINGILVQKDGAPTGARPGLVLRSR